MTLRQRALGVLALLGLTSILIGLPMLLIAVGADSLPQELPTWEQVQTALLTPDDGTLALSALKGLGWVIWVALSADDPPRSSRPSTWTPRALTARVAVTPGHHPRYRRHRPGPVRNGSRNYTPADSERHSRCHSPTDHRS